jgi:hypothetical protein
MSGEMKGEMVAIDGEEYKKVGVMARMLRTYPSLIRDFHFYSLLSESKKFESVRYSLAQDYFQGLDIEVVYRGKPFFISVFVETRRASTFKKKKYSRHDYDGIPEISLGLAFSSLKKLGSIYVCQAEHVDQVIDKIEKL